jgi:hypothetical protein
MANRRFELPEGLGPDDERLVLASLERYLRRERPLPNAWSLAGRMDAAGHGALQARRHLRGAWRSIARAEFARPGVPSYQGRADAR